MKTSKQIRTLCCLSTLFACAIFIATLHAAEARRPNVVFILVDDMGYADTGCYGAEDIRTPNIDRLAREGVRMTDFYANAPVCTPTRAAFITGRYQQRVGLEWAIGTTGLQSRREGDKWVTSNDMKELGLPTSEPSIARILKEAGYRTAMFGKWHLGWAPEFGPNAHGFDEFWGILMGHADYYTKKYKTGLHHLFENKTPATDDGYLTDSITQRAIEFIQRQKEEPFFLYVPYNAPHWPFQVPDRPDLLMDPDDTYKGTRQDYVAMVERIDLGMGKMLDMLHKQGVLKDTLFIFSSDNGGERLSSNFPLFNHKTTLWEGGIRVPCILRWPDHLPAGKVSKQAGITMDLTATILVATGTKTPVDKPQDGINLLPMLSGDMQVMERTFFWRVAHTEGELARQQRAVRCGKWKYVLDGMIPLLFDLEVDIGERSNLAYKHPETLAKLKLLLAEWEEDLERNPPPFRVN